MKTMKAFDQPWRDPAAVACLEETLGRRILFMDGAMGTMIQGRDLNEQDFELRADVGIVHGVPTDLRSADQ